MRMALHRLRDRTVAGLKGLLALSLLLGSLAGLLGVALTAEPAAAAGPPTIGPGVATYSFGATTPTDQFDVLTLVTGGAVNVNPASLTIVTNVPGADGSAAVTTATATHGIITLTNTAAATGNFSLTFAYCAPTFTYPNPAQCTTQQLVYQQPSVGQDFG